MRISSVSARPTRRRPVDLMVGTALGCSLLIVANPAAASDECGPAVGGVVTCAAAGSPYATGIQYAPPAGGLTMNFEAATSVDSTGTGVSVTSAGPVTVNARNTNIRATTGGQVGRIAVEVRSGDTTEIHVGAVQASGDFAFGVAAILGGDGSGGDDLLVTADAITISGVQANGVWAWNNSGDINIDAGTIAISGDRSNGIFAQGEYDVTVDVETLVASDGADGVEVQSAGVATVHVGSLTTSSDGAGGITVYGGTLTAIEFGSVTTDGFNATGIFVEPDSGEVLIRGGSVTARGGGDDFGAAILVDQSGSTPSGSDTVTVEVGTIVTGKVDAGGVHSGDNGHGLQVDGVADVNFDIGSIITHGQNAQGVTIGTQGQITGTVGTVETWGDFANGLNLEAMGGMAAEFNSIRTHGEYAMGVLAYAEAGDIDITGGGIETFGENAHGVLAATSYGDITLDLGTVKTSGASAYGAWVGGSYDGGRIDLSIDSIETSGSGAPGLLVRPQESDMTITLGSVKTTGDSAWAVFIDQSQGGSLTLTADEVVTTGFDSSGVIVDQGGDATVDLGTVSTRGDHSRAVEILRDPELSGPATVILTADAIHTGHVAADGAVTGYDADAINIVNGGDTTVNVGTVTTLGNLSDAIAINGLEAGRVEVTATGAISTTGSGSSGVLVEQGGAATLDLGTVSTRGHNARGIAILHDPELTDPAAVVLTVDAVHTGYVDADGAVTGFEADAIQIVNAGDTTVNAGTVTTVGGASDAISIDALGTGHVTVTATGAISTNSGSGIAIGAADGAIVRVANVATRQSNSDAIVIDAYDDDGEMTRGVTLVAGDISTLGHNSRGIAVDAAGDVRITTGDISTEGDTSVAINGSSVRGSLRMEVGDIHTDGIASSGLGAHAFGDVTVTAGDIEILSSSAEGVVVGSETGNVTLTVGDVVTEGHSDSDAITVDMGAEDRVLRLTAGAVEARDTPGYGLAPGNSAIVVQNGGFSGIRVASALTNSINAAAIQIDGAGTGQVDLNVTGAVVSTNARSGGVRVLNATEVDIRAAEVRTGGSDSAGVKLGMVDYEVTGDVTVAIGQIRTTGDRSHGLDIATTGDVAVTSQLVSATGAGSRAILIDADDAVILDLGSAIATATDGVAVQASGRSVEMTVATELRGTRIGADLDAARTLAVTLGAGSSTSGSVFGLDLSSGAGTTVTNRGSISSTDGVALNVDGGAATISNIGNLAGRIDLTEAADRLTNSGTFRLRGESDFGGASDILDNTGMLTFAESTTPLLARLRNLERFNNGGTIDLTNGVAGDVLTIDGALNGQTGNRVLLDLDTRTTTVVADRLVVGSLEGLTNVELEIQGAGVIGQTGVTLVTSAVAQTGQELLVTTAGGFLEYNAVFDAASREYRIVGAAADRAWEPTKVASGAQMQWRRGADVISARFDELRDSGAMGLRQGGGVEAWAQAFGGGGEVDGQRVIDDEAVDLSHDVDVAGGQVGVDLVRGFGGGDLVLGLTGSVSETELEFHSNGDKATFSGFGLGAYAQWSRGPLAIGVLAKGDSYDLEYDWVSADLSDEADGSTFGVRVDAAWRIDVGSGWIIEPQASTWWTETNLDSISAEAGEVEFGDTTSLIGRAGVRVAHAMSLLGGAMVQPFVGVYGYNEFEGDNASRIHIGSETLEVADAAADLWGEAVFGANVGDGMIQGFVQGEAAFGEISGFTARVGVRMNW